MGGGSVLFCANTIKLLYSIKYSNKRNICPISSPEGFAYCSLKIRVLPPLDTKTNSRRLCNKRVYASNQ